MAGSGCPGRDVPQSTRRAPPSTFRGSPSPGAGTPRSGTGDRQSCMWPMCGSPLTMTGKCRAAPVFCGTLWLIKVKTGCGRPPAFGRGPVLCVPCSQRWSWVSSHPPPCRAAMKSVTPADFLCSCFSASIISKRTAVPGSRILPSVGPWKSPDACRTPVRQSPLGSPYQ